MRVAFIVRSTLYTSYGGDSVQVLATAKYLEQKGVSVDIKLAHERIHYENYTLLHFFNIIRPDDILPHIKQSKIPFVVSSIFLDYSFYQNTSNNKLYPMLFKIFNPQTIEYVKLLGRCVFNGERLPSFNYLIKGQKKSIQHILKQTDAVLPNSLSEYKRLCKEFNPPKYVEIVPNGIDAETFISISPVQRIPNKIICVGRVEIRKNQLNLIRALNNTPFQLYIIGKPSFNHIKYYQTCKEEAADNIHFIERVPHEELLFHYASSQVHVLPSWFETTGLSSLEAAYMGCNVVVTKHGDTVDYFEKDAFYCDPASPASILNAIQKAALAPSPMVLIERIKNQFTWHKAAEKTFNAYQKIVKVA